MRSESKTLRWLAFLGTALLAFYLGRLSVSTRPPPATSSVATPATRHEAAPQLKSKPDVATMAAESSRPAVTTDWENRWRELAARSGSRLRDQEIIAAIEELAARDAARALSLAQAEPNMRLRLEMFRAALRGWARTAPDAAADWARSDQTALERSDAISAVLTGTAKNPDTALKLTARLLEKDPAHARDHGVALIAALGGAGEFEQAARFAVTGDEDSREDWLTTAYSLWADYQPDAALTAVGALTDPGSKRKAFDAAITAWSCNSPEAAATYAAALGAGEEKKFAITVALQHWAANDPVAAAHWIHQLDPAPELDAGAASVAVDFHNFKHPSDAVEWAESVTDPELRSNTLVTVIRRWAELDSAGAQEYLKRTTGLRPNDRSELLADFAAAKNP